MNLKTNYMGFDLPHPLIPGASPLTRNLDTVKELEDAGAAAINMPSLFEEQIVEEQIASNNAREHAENAHAEALSYIPEHDDAISGPDEYLERVSRIKQAVSIPVFASLNGNSPGGWLRYARLIEQAGADAIELNVYDLPTDPDIASTRIEWNTIEMVRQITATVRIPVAVKLSPFYSSLPHFARQIQAAGAKGIVIFNRFYQPDILMEELEVLPSVNLSTSSELLLRLRWLAILHGVVQPHTLAATGGVHTAVDAIKAVMTGASVVQMVSALLMYGPEHLTRVKTDMTRWMESHEYESLNQMHGSMSLDKCPNPRALERANYMQVLQSWRSA